MGTQSINLRIRQVQLSPFFLPQEMNDRNCSKSIAPFFITLLSQFYQFCYLQIKFIVYKSFISRYYWSICVIFASCLFYFVQGDVVNVLQETYDTIDTTKKRLHYVQDQFDCNQPKEHYIVLVSLPILDKIIPLKHLAEELIQRGYRVGFALPENCRSMVSDIAKLEFISLGTIPLHNINTNLRDQDKRNGYMKTHEIYNELYTKGFVENYSHMLQYYTSFYHIMFTRLLEDLEEDRPHLLVIDRHAFAAFDVCHQLEIQYVIHSPTLLMEIDTPPSYIPAPFTNIQTIHSNIWERLTNGYHRLRFRLGLLSVIKTLKNIQKEHGVSPKNMMYPHSSHQILISNSVFGIDEARKIGSSILMVGHFNSPSLSQKMLPHGLSIWFNMQKIKGSSIDIIPLILISFPMDTVLPTGFIPKLMDALNQVPGRFICKLENHYKQHYQFELSDSIYIVDTDISDDILMEYLPIQLFISAGDLTSLQTALVRGIPILGIPCLAEQYEVVQSIVRNGAGLLVSYENISTIHMQQRILQVISNSTYTNSAVSLGEILKSNDGVHKVINTIDTLLAWNKIEQIPISSGFMTPYYIWLKSNLLDIYVTYGLVICASYLMTKTFFAIGRSLIQFDDSTISSSNTYPINNSTPSNSIKGTLK